MLNISWLLGGSGIKIRIQVCLKTELLLIQSYYKYAVYYKYSVLL